MAPSADIGDRHAVFPLCHGTAPDLVGEDRHGDGAERRAAVDIAKAVVAIAASVLNEVGGDLR